jgi:hypothetical protein
MSIYTTSFYKTQVNPSYLSALEYAKSLLPVFNISSVIDIGCGRGSWLKAFMETFSLNSTHILGIDGPWNSRSDLILDCNYISFDLEKADQLKLPHYYDLAISLEVAEHISRYSSRGFVSALCMHADLIIFSSANFLQGGIGHINESSPSYWANLFAENDFAVFAFFRPRLWGNTTIKWWYQQNTFLYAKYGSPSYNLLLENSCEPIENLCIMDAIHPQIFAERSTVPGLLKHLIHRYLPDSVVLFLYNLRKRFD